jgi:hypothetical protein
MPKGKFFPILFVGILYFSSILMTSLKATSLEDIEKQVQGYQANYLKNRPNAQKETKAATVKYIELAEKLKAKVIRILEADAWFTERNEVKEDLEKMNQLASKTALSASTVGYFTSVFIYYDNTSGHLSSHERTKFLIALEQGFKKMVFYAEKNLASMNL